MRTKQVSLRLDINESDASGDQPLEVHSLCFENQRKEEGRKKILLEVDADAAWFIREAFKALGEKSETFRNGIYEDWLTEEMHAVCRRAWPELYDNQEQFPTGTGG